MKNEISKRFQVFQINDNFQLEQDNSFDHVLINVTTKEDALIAVDRYLREDDWGFATNYGSFVILEVITKKPI